MPTAIVLSHRGVADDLGLIGQWLDDHGWVTQRIWREDSPTWSAFEPADDDALIVLGSLSSVATGHCAPWAESEISRIRDWVAAGHRYLGVCFGAQALAVALGGHVERMPSFVRTVTDVEWVGGRRRGPWVAWHEDAIRSAGSGELIGRLPHAILALRHGRAWGIQPHIELDADGVERLGRAAAVPPEVWLPIAAAARAHERELRQASFDLLDEILGG